MKKQPKNPVIKPTDIPKKEEVKTYTVDKEPEKVTARILLEIYKRLGYMIKLLEEKKSNG